MVTQIDYSKLIAPKLGAYLYLWLSSYWSKAEQRG